jgi:hypothetical protein
MPTSPSFKKRNSLLINLNTIAQAQQPGQPIIGFLDSGARAGMDRR